MNLAANIWESPHWATTISNERPSLCLNSTCPLFNDTPPAWERQKSSNQGAFSSRSVWTQQAWPVGSSKGSATLLSQHIPTSHLKIRQAGVVSNLLHPKLPNVPPESFPPRPCRMSFAPGDFWPGVWGRSRGVVPKHFQCPKIKNMPLGCHFLFVRLKTMPKDSKVLKQPRNSPWKLQNTPPKK